MSKLLPLEAGVPQGSILGPTETVKKPAYSPSSVSSAGDCVDMLMVYHSLIQVHKTVLHKSPTYLYDRVTSQLGILAAKSTYFYQTRQTDSGAERQLPGTEARLDLTSRS